MRQIDLIPTRRPQPADIPIDFIRRRTTFIGAVQLAIDASGLEDKEIYRELDLDAGAFSRIRKGTAWLPQDKRLLKFFDLVHNDILLIWLAEARGYDWSTIHKHRSSDQRLIEELQQENAALLRALNKKISAEARS